MGLCTFPASGCTKCEYLESFCEALSHASEFRIPTSMILRGAFTVAACSLPSELLNWRTFGESVSAQNF
jgi:hypothetical protein